MVVDTRRSKRRSCDVIEEPVPGVFVVTEFVETNAEPKPTNSPISIKQPVRSRKSNSGELARAQGCAFSQPSPLMTRFDMPK